MFKHRGRPHCASRDIAKSSGRLVVAWVLQEHHAAKLTLPTTYNHVTAPQDVKLPTEAPVNN